MKCAIMQPTYLPWIGYFNLIASVDVFVFLDDVQFAKRSWQQRNRILLNGAEKFLTIPALTKGKRDQTIKEVSCDISQEWKKDHLNTLEHAYIKHKYGPEMLDVVARALNQPHFSLSETNIEIITAILTKLGLSTKLVKSSDIAVTGKKSEYLFNICNHIGANVYLSAAGSKEYIEEEGIFELSTIKVEYQSFEIIEYPQQGVSTFVPYMSIVDMIANIGFANSNLIVRG